ncbi:barstar family protein [Streptomyces sp. NBC_00582]|uniref:barstar family protein n=1 Tax=Streptomyces sp. NBC_00582 TaxID=2975783 RepID=UPI002E81C617|nr:barstar family protein [Streptomyces sp. NBC_00582]WUB65049.1 barstar family protein [Streptomyces sp. NBC_00582]
MKVFIDGASIRSEGDLHRFLSHALDFGPYYGANPSALWDRLSTDVERPVDIVWKNSSASRAALGEETFERIRALLLRVQAQDDSYGFGDRFSVTFA